MLCLLLDAERFNPVHKGHLSLVNAVTSHAWKHDGDHMIFASHTHDANKNPLGHREKIKFMQKAFPNVNIDKSNNIRTPLDAIDHLSKKGYSHITMVVGKDREQTFTNLLARYHKDNPHIEQLKVHSPKELERDPDVSASKMREHAKNKNFNEFKKGVVNPNHAKEMYRAVRKGMKLENFQPHFKALFVVGGPGSGKDFIVNTILGESNLLEISLDKLSKAVNEQENLSELNNYPSLIVNGNADNLSKVVIAKKVLETMGYDTAMVYVYTSDEESKARNDERISRGAKTFNEEVRHEKYSNSIKNLHNYVAMFDQSNVFDNTFDFSSVGALKKQEILGWVQELGSSIGSFYESLVSNDSARIWLMENVGKKNMGMDLPKVPKPTGSGEKHSSILKGYKRVKVGSFWKLVKEKYDELQDNLTEGGNIKIGEHSAEPIHVTEKNRGHIQSDIHHTLGAIHDSMQHEHGIHLFGKDKKALHNGTAYSGSTEHLMNSKISHKEFAHHKSSVGDVDVKIPAEHKEKLEKHLTIGKHFGNYHVVGIHKHGNETSALMKHHSGKIHQFDFEHTEYKHDEPTKGEHLGHSSDWEDTKKGIKGVHHKMLLNAVGRDKYKYSITHGLKSRMDEKDQGSKEPEHVTHKLFGHKADSSKIGSFHGVTELIRHHIPKEHHQEIYDKFKSSTESKKKLNSSVALHHLGKALGLNHLHEMGGQPGGIGGSDSGGDTDKYEPMAKDAGTKKKKYVNIKMKPPKNKGEKASLSPPSFFDARMGMVPSGGVGIVVSQYIVPERNVLKEKSLEKLRKNMTALINNSDKDE